MALTRTGLFETLLIVFGPVPGMASLEKKAKGLEDLSLSLAKAESCSANPKNEWRSVLLLNRKLVWCL